MNERLYPVQALGRNVTNILMNIHSANIREEIQKGLNNQIIYFDEGTHISNIAEIYKVILDKDTAQVRISAAYCQYLWLICDATYKWMDYITILDEINKYDITLEEFINYIQTLSIEEIKSKIHNTSQVEDINRIIEYSRRISNFNKELPISIMKELTLADSLKDRSQDIDFVQLNAIDLNGNYEVLSNSVYCNGIAFILLHEASHFSLGHLNREYHDGDEEAADFSAYWSLLNDVDGEQKFSAGCGIMSTLFSFLFLNEDLSVDGEHPRDDIRIFSFYELVKDDNPKYLNLLIRLFEIWGCHQNEYPMNLPPTEESISIIKEYIASRFK